MKLQFADLALDNANVPVATKFDDVYFSKDDGIAESEYVFFNGNQLAERWIHHENTSFIIAETGFGTGLNIALAIDKFLHFRQTHPASRLQHLHLISFELHPIAHSNLQKIVSHWPQFEQTYRAILAAYPPNLAGTYRIEMYDGRVTLDLILGNIADTIINVSRPLAGIDAWFLDGFAPSKNEAMWQDAVFRQIQRLSHEGTTIATFTSAGFVRRGLEAAGFNISKTPGFGRKREMITGVMTTNLVLDEPRYSLRTGAAEKNHCTVVGAGIAGLLTCLALLKRGLRVTLLCKKDIGDGASGNQLAGFYPQLQAEYSIQSQFYWTCFCYAYQFYRNLHTHFAFDHAFDGALLLGFNEKQTERIAKMQARQLWPETLATFVDADKASQIAGISIPHGGLFLKDGGWVSPISLINAAFESCSHYDDFTFHKETELVDFISNEQDVSLVLRTHNKDIQHKTTDALVIAAGADAGRLLDGFDLRLTRGQVEFLPTSDDMQHLQTLVCHKGYFTPSYNGYHALGSTYVKNEVNTDTHPTETLENINTHKSAMPGSHWARYLDAALNAKNAFSRASIRCSTPDHLPIVGNIPDIAKQNADYAQLSLGKPSNKKPKNRDNCFVIGGLGSRGFTTGPLCAELIAAQITEQPLPFSTTLLNALNPNRFLIRALKRA